MKKNYENFLVLLNNGICDRNDNVECSIEDVEFEAKNHICIPFIYKGAQNIGLSIPKKWSEHMVISTLNNQKNLQVQDMILHRMEKAGISCAVLKGSSVSTNYTEPLLRTLGDVDILVKPSDYDRAIELLCGDKNADESYEGHAFHFKYTVHGVPIEIHKYVTEYSSAAYVQIIEKLMNKALDTTFKRSIDEFEFPVLDSKYQAATLLLHTQRHFFENRLPLRMLCDWAMYVKSIELSEWKEKVFPFVSQMGLADLCDALTATVNRYFSVKCEEKISKKISDDLTEMLILEFLNNGVIEDVNSFSRTIGTSYTQQMDGTTNKIIPLIKHINNIARNEFNLARISPLFLPLFWIYIPSRYVYRFFSGKRSGISFKAFNDTVSRKGFLINKLKLKD